MAGATLTTLAELIKEQYKTPFIDAMDRDITVFQFFPRQNYKGDHREFEVHYAGNSGVGSYTEEGDIPTAGSQSYKKARTPYKLVGASARVTGLVEAATQGEGGFMPAFQSEVKEVLEDLKDDINDMLLSTSSPGNSGADITGFPYIISDTGTYCGLDRSTYTWWQSYVLDNSGTDRDLTIALMQDVRRTLLDPSRKAKVSQILTSYKHFDDYGNLMADNRRWTGAERMDAGYDALRFYNTEVVAIPNLADGAMYFIDKRHWEFGVLKDFDTEPRDPGTKDAKQIFISMYAELICTHPGRQAKITDLA